MEMLSSTERTSLLDSVFPIIINNQVVNREDIEPNMGLLLSFPELVEKDKVNSYKINLIIKALLSNDFVINNNITNLINKLSSLGVLPEDWSTVIETEIEKQDPLSRLEPYTSEEIQSIFND